MEYTDDEAALADAEAHAREGRWQPALERYQAVVQRKPRDLLVRQKAAQALAALGRKGEAVAELQHIVDRFAKDGMLLRAIAVCSVILEVDPGHRATHRQLADLYARKHGTPPPPSLFPPPPPEPSQEVNQSAEVHGVSDAMAVCEALVSDAREDDGFSTPSGEAHVSMTDVPETPLFAELAPEEFLEVMQLLTLRRAAAGQVIIREGDVGQSMYIIVRGLVDVVHTDADGNVTPLKELSSGAFFGEMALLSNAPRLATVTAREETLLLELSKANLQTIVEKHPSVGGVLERFHHRRLLNSLMGLNPIFQAVHPQDRTEMLSRFETLSVPAGTTLLAQGQPGDGLYLLLRGRCDVAIDEEEGTRALPTLKEGDVFGEVSLIYATPCTATVKTATDAIVMRLKREAFTALVPSDSSAGAMVRKLGAERLKRAGLRQVLDMDG